MTTFKSLIKTSVPDGLPILSITHTDFIQKYLVLDETIKKNFIKYPVECKLDGIRNILSHGNTIFYCLVMETIKSLQEECSVNIERRSIASKCHKAHLRWRQRDMRTQDSRTELQTTS